MTNRGTDLRAPAIALGAGIVFGLLAVWVSDAPPFAILGGALWVGFLSLIVTLPLLGREGA